MSLDLVPVQSMPIGTRNANAPERRRYDQQRGTSTCQAKEFSEDLSEGEVRIDLSAHVRNRQPALYYSFN